MTGATGFVGRQLIPLLARGGATLLLVGRDPERIKCIFPAYAACGYPDLAKDAEGFDLLVHLAAVNSQAGLPLEETRKVNVGLLADLVACAERAGISKLINISSTHALREGKRSAYAQTKREAADWLRDAAGDRATTVYLPPVYGNGWSGKMAFLNRLPRRLSQPLFRIAAALSPTLHVERLAEFILSSSASDPGPEIILTDGQAANVVYKTVKRGVDLSFALVVIGFFWWLLAAIWVLVRLQSPGPAIFAQPRVGRNGGAFTCYKFRSMKVGTIQAATNEVSPDAVTPVGRFLRKSKLDELPQVWNILRNELSVVGPRPCLLSQRSLIEARARRGVLALKPGITGFSQIRGIDMSDPERLAASDARYLALQSLLLDARILLATMMGHGQGDRIVAAGEPISTGAANPPPPAPRETP